MAMSSAKSALRSKMKNILKNISPEEKKAQSVKVLEKVSVNKTIILTWYLWGEREVERLC